MFNFFESLYKENKLKIDNKTNVNMVFVDGKILYIEGHKEIYKLENDVIVIKLKNNIVTVKGENLFLKNLKRDTITIQGNIKNIDLL